MSVARKSSRSATRGWKMKCMSSKSLQSKSVYTTPLTGQA